MSGLNKRTVKTTEEIVHVEVTGEAADALKELYKIIWMEAHYDFDTPETNAFAKKLWPHIGRLNTILEFNK